MDGPGALLRYAECVGGIPSFQYVITFHFEELERDSAHAFVIFCKQDCLGTNWGLCFEQFLRFGFGQDRRFLFFRHTRQPNLNGCALAGRARDFDQPPALFYRSVHHGKSQTSAFALFFGAEKWFEDVRASLFTHSTAIITDREYYALL